MQSFSRGYVRAFLIDGILLCSFNDCCCSLLLPFLSFFAFEEQKSRCTFKDIFYKFKAMLESTFETQMESISDVECEQGARSPFEDHAQMPINLGGKPVVKVLSRADLRLQGKVAELRLELNSGGKKDKNHSAKKIALKKIVANMTMSNNDMVALFPDVVGCMQIPSLEIKKMYVLPENNSNLHGY